MKHKLLTAVAATAMLASPSFAQDADTGWYLRGNIGAGGYTDMDFTGDLQGDVEAEYNGAGSLGLGYEFGNGWRLEADGTQLWNDLGAISQLPNTAADLRTSALMLNAIYDFDDFGRWEPYVGAGLGYVRHSLSAQTHDFPSANPFGAGTGAVNVMNPACSPICTFDNDDSGLGWQVLAGLGYAITDNLSWDTHYKYLNTNDGDFEGLRQQTVNGNGSEIDTTLTDIGAHMLMTGFRYRFGAKKPMMACWNGDMVKDLTTCPDRPAPPPPPPAIEYTTCEDGSRVVMGNPCPVTVRYISCPDGSQVQEGTACPVVQRFTCPDGSIVSDEAICETIRIEALCAQEFRQEIIYYDFNKGQSAETEATIQRILDTGQYCSVGNVNVVGHTDTSGSAAYNLNLSKRRAKDAADELVRRGINPAIITSEGKGETSPFIDTGDGVKEQLNRRTEVLIRLNSVGVVN